MTRLPSLLYLSARLKKDGLRVLVAAGAGLEHAATVVQADARQRLGAFQAELAAAGGPVSHMEDVGASIVIEHQPAQVTIGSKLPLAAEMEFGTAQNPPRPFLGPAVNANHDKIVAAVGGAAMTGFTGGP